MAKPATIADLSKLLKLWKKRLNLEHWELELSIDNNLPMAGVCEASWEYLHAHITVNPVKVADRDGDMEAILVHELCHVLLDAIWQTSDTSVEAVRLMHERTTEELTYVLLGAYRKA